MNKGSRIIITDDNEKKNVIKNQSIYIDFLSNFNLVNIDNFIDIINNNDINLYSKNRLINIWLRINKSKILNNHTILSDYIIDIFSLKNAEQKVKSYIKSWLKTKKSNDFNFDIFTDIENKFLNN